jgi:outer membrane biosynthesis protein TonB
MNRKNTLSVVLAFAVACALALVAFVPPAHADAWDKRTIVTFSQPVEIPGQILPAGKYVFKLVDSPSDRHIVRIMNERENHVFATVLAIPDYRMETPSKTIFTFYEMPAGQPEVVREWFYPGDNYGQEFAYSKKRHAEILAAIKGQTTETVVAVATPAPTPAPVETETTPEIAATPTPAPEPTPSVAEEPAPESPAAEPMDATPAPEPAQEPAPAPSDDTKSMPKTASDLALIGLLGCIAAFSALGVRQYRRSSR